MKQDNHTTIRTLARRTAVLAIGLILSLAGVATEAGNLQADRSTNRRDHILSSMVTFRAAGIVAPEFLQGLVEQLPEGVLGPTGDPKVLRLAAWSQFMHNSIVKIGRLESDRPVGLYYNPLSDVALLIDWHFVSGDAWAPRRSVAVPGEMLAGADLADCPLQPGSLGSADPVESIRSTTAARLRAFTASHPVDASVGAAQLVEGGESPNDIQGLVEVRILSNLHASLRATVGVDSGLMTPLLDQIEKQQALWQIPEDRLAALEFAAGFELSPEHRILLLADPADGHRYVSVSFTLVEPDLPALRSVRSIDITRRMP